MLIRVVPQQDRGSRFQVAVSPLRQAQNWGQGPVTASDVAVLMKNPGITPNISCPGNLYLLATRATRLTCACHGRSQKLAQRGVGKNCRLVQMAPGKTTAVQRIVPQHETGGDATIRPWLWRSGEFGPEERYTEFILRLHTFHCPDRRKPCRPRHVCLISRRLLVSTCLADFICRRLPVSTCPIDFIFRRCPSLVASLPSFGLQLPSAV